MSFSRKVKEELVSQTGNGRHCLIAEFAAIFALTGKIRKDRDGDIYSGNQDRKLDSCPKILYLNRVCILCKSRYPGAKS